MSDSVRNADLSAPDKPMNLRQLLSLPIIWALATSGFALSFLAAAFDVVFVLFCYSPVHSGGLAFSVSHLRSARFSRQHELLSPGITNWLFISNLWRHIRCVSSLHHVLLVTHVRLCENVQFLYGVVAIYLYRTSYPEHHRT